MKPKSDTIFHFTKEISFLQDILLNGFWPRYCLEDMRWYSGNDSLSAYPMVCFCDIPLSRVDEHVDFYGDYGIGVTREWAQKNGLSPVLYLNESSIQHQSIKRLFLNNLESPYYKEAADDINNLISYIKPISGKMLISDKFIEKDFYQENEWRYSVGGVASELKVRPFLYESEYRNPKILDDQNSKSKSFYSLVIQPSDIRYLFVRHESDIPGLANFIHSKLEHYSNADVKILTSKIMSLETIRRDL